MPKRLSSVDVTPGLLLRAYAAGLFPMAESAEDPDLFWVEPETRGVFPLDGLIVSRSLAKVIRSDRFAIRIDADFDAVIEACAEAVPNRPSTWINGTIRRLYRNLFEQGFAHSVEVYREARLVGGLYGVAIGGAFFGESMFHRQTDASKTALVHLAALLLEGGYRLLDAQFVTPHLARLGAVELPRAAYRQRLMDAIGVAARFPKAGEELSGQQAIEAVRRATSTPGLDNAGVPD